MCMRLLVVSRLSLHDNIIKALRRRGIKEFVDYFKHKQAYTDEKDILQVYNMEKCDSVAVICNFSLAVRLMAHGVDTVFIIVPKLHTLTDIVSADVYKINGKVRLEKFTT